MNGAVRTKPKSPQVSRAGMRGAAVLWIAAALLCSCSGPWGYGGITGYDDRNVPTGVTDPNDWVPDGVIDAAHVYPNPAQHRANLVFELSDSADVTIEVYSNPRTRIRVLGSVSCKAAVNTISWDCRDAQGRALASGIYRVYIRAVDGDGQSWQTYGDVEIDD